MLTSAQLRAFAADGYLVVRGAVSVQLQATAITRITQLQAAPAGRDFQFPLAAFEPELGALLTPALAAAAQLTCPLRLTAGDRLQIAVTVPPVTEEPQAGHLDGFSVTEESGRPGTFTLLAGVVLSDQSEPERGNLIVWPGSHRRSAAMFARQGIASMLASGGHPDYAHDNPTPVLAQAGDVILCHYLLSHNTGPHLGSIARRTVYFRLQAAGHTDRWAAAIADASLEFAHPVGVDGSIEGAHR
jgi:hypothetical protein